MLRRFFFFYFFIIYIKSWTTHTEVKSLILSKQSIDINITGLQYNSQQVWKFNRNITNTYTCTMQMLFSIKCRFLVNSHLSYVHIPIPTSIVFFSLASFYMANTNIIANVNKKIERKKYICIFCVNGFLIKIVASIFKIFIFWINAGYTA